MRFTLTLITLSFILLLPRNEAQAQTWAQKLEASIILGESGIDTDFRSFYAVKEVISNRVKKRGQSRWRVMTQRKQFSCLNGTTPEKLIQKFQGSKRWDEAVKVVLDPTPTNFTLNADHYEGVLGKKGKNNLPYWADPKKLTIRIGGHNFYKLE